MHSKVKRRLKIKDKSIDTVKTSNSVIASHFCFGVIRLSLIQDSVILPFLEIKGSVLEINTLCKIIFINMTLN